MRRYRQIRSSTMINTTIAYYQITAKLGAAALLIITIATPLSALEPVPDKLVVLTFDDSVKSHFTHVRPILKKHGFGATFFITEGFEFKTNKNHYMTWEEIAQLHRDLELAIKPAST